MQDLEGEKLQRRRRVQQCNLELYGNESLSVLASSNLQFAIGGEGSVLDAARASRGKGVTATRGSCSSDQVSGKTN